MTKKLSFEELPKAVALLLEEVAEIKKMLKSNGATAKNSRAAASVSPEGMVDMEKVCEILGRTKQTVYGLLKSGALKARKHGRKQLFVLDEVMKYDASPRKKTRKSKKQSEAKQGRKPRQSKAKQNDAQ